MRPIYNMIRFFVLLAALPMALFVIIEGTMDAEKKRRYEAGEL